MTTKTEKPQHPCYCGCHELTSACYYRPGHDARHLSRTFMAWLASNEDSLDAYWRAIRALPTEALRHKLRTRMFRHSGFSDRAHEMGSSDWQARMRLYDLVNEVDSEGAPRFSANPHRIAGLAAAQGWTVYSVNRRRS